MDEVFTPTPKESQKLQSGLFIARLWSVLLHHGAVYNGVVVRATTGTGHRQCVVITFSRLGIINRVWVPILLVWPAEAAGKWNFEFFLFPLAPENTVSRVRFGWRRVPRQPAHSSPSACPFFTPGLNRVLTYGNPCSLFPLRFPSERAVIRHRVSPELVNHATGVHHREFPAQALGRKSSKVVLLMGAQEISWANECAPLSLLTHSYRYRRVDVCVKEEVWRFEGMCAKRYYVPPSKWNTSL